MIEGRALYCLAGSVTFTSLVIGYVNWDKERERMVLSLWGFINFQRLKVASIKSEERKEKRRARID